MHTADVLYWLLSQSPESKGLLLDPSSSRRSRGVSSSCVPFHHQSKHRTLANVDNVSPKTIYRCRSRCRTRAMLRVPSQVCGQRALRCSTPIPLLPRIHSTLRVQRRATPADRVFPPCDSGAVRQRRVRTTTRSRLVSASHCAGLGSEVFSVQSSSLRTYYAYQGVLGIRWGHARLGSWVEACRCAG